VTGLIAVQPLESKAVRANAAGWHRRCSAGWETAGRPPAQAAAMTGDTRDHGTTTRCRLQVRTCMAWAVVGVPRDGTPAARLMSHRDDAASWCMPGSASLVSTALPARCWPRGHYPCPRSHASGRPQGTSGRLHSSSYAGGFAYVSSPTYPGCL
jgi:hypothetical protein